MRTLYIFSLLAYTCNCDVVYPASVCVIGDVQVDYNKARDPRTLMGTYTRVDLTTINSTLDTTIVDLTAPIYEHINFGSGPNNTLPSGTQQAQYLYKVPAIGENGGWALSETLPFICPTSDLNC